MKKYQVMRLYKHATASVLFECDDLDDAKDYARIMSHQDEYMYSVAEAIYTIGG